MSVSDVKTHKNSERAPKGNFVTDDVLYESQVPSR